MDFEKVVAGSGTEAILRYRTITGGHPDNQVPPSFIRSFIAGRLHERLGLHVHVDRPFTTIALELGMPLDKELADYLGGLRADVAVYERGRPSRLVHLEVFDSASHLPPGSAAMDRADFLARSGQLQAVIAVMVCPFFVSLEGRIERLHELFGGDMYVDERQPSWDDRWSWCFACAALGKVRRAP